MSMRELGMLATSIKALGCDLPPKLGALIGTQDLLLDAVTKMEASARNMPPSIRLGAKPSDVLAAVTEAADARQRSLSIAETASDVLGRMVGQYENGIRSGDTGTEIIEAIRPIFDQAAAGLAEANLHLSPDDTAASIVDRANPGPAIQAWQTVGDHSRALTAIFREVLVPLVRDFNAVGSHDWSVPVPSMATAFVIDGDHRGNPEGAQQTLGPNMPHTNPGGGWHKLLRNGWVLRLNTPAEARTVCDAHDKAKAEQRRTHLDAEADLKRRVSQGYVELGRA